MNWAQPPKDDAEITQMSNGISAAGVVPSTTNLVAFDLTRVNGVLAWRDGDTSTIVYNQLGGCSSGWRCKWIVPPQLSDSFAAVAAIGNTQGAWDDPAVGNANIKYALCTGVATFFTPTPTKHILPIPTVSLTLSLLESISVSLSVTPERLRSKTRTRQLPRNATSTRRAILPLSTRTISLASSKTQFPVTDAHTSTAAPMNDTTTVAPMTIAPASTVPNVTANATDVATTTIVPSSASPATQSPPTSLPTSAPQTTSTAVLPNLTTSVPTTRTPNPTNATAVPNVTISVNTTTAPPPAPDPEAWKEKKEIKQPSKAQETTVTASTATAATVSIVGSGAASGDVQSLALMGSIECASKAVKNVTGGMDWILQPFGQWVNKSYGTLLSSIVVVPSALALHRGVAFLVGKLPHPSLQKDPETVLSFPGLTCDVGMLFAQGTLLNAMKQLFAAEKDIVGVILACVTFLILLAYGAWIAYFHRTRGDRGIYYGKFHYAQQKVPAPLRPILMPLGRWFPRICKYRYASTLNMYKEDRLFFAFCPLIVMLLNAAIAAFRSKTPEQCDYQYIALGIIPVVQSLLIIVLRPFRYNVLVVLHAISGVIVGFAIASPAIPAIQQFTTTLVMAVTIASAVSGGFGMVLALFERMKLKSWEKELSSKEDGEGDSGRIDVSAAGDTGGGLKSNPGITSPLLKVADSEEMLALNPSLDLNPLGLSTASSTGTLKSNASFDHKPRRRNSSRKTDDADVVDDDL